MQTTAPQILCETALRYRKIKNALSHTKTLANQWIRTQFPATDEYIFHGAYVCDMTFDDFEIINFQNNICLQITLTLQRPTNPYDDQSKLELFKDIFYIEMGKWIFFQDDSIDVIKMILTSYECFEYEATSALIECASKLPSSDEQKMAHILWDQKAAVNNIAKAKQEATQLMARLSSQVANSLTDGKFYILNEHFQEADSLTLSISSSNDLNDESLFFHGITVQSQTITIGQIENIGPFFIGTLTSNPTDLATASLDALLKIIAFDLGGVDPSTTQTQQEAVWTMEIDSAELGQSIPLATSNNKTGGRTSSL